MVDSIFPCWASSAATPLVAGLATWSHVGPGSPVKLQPAAFLASTVNQEFGGASENGRIKLKLPKYLHCRALAEKQAAMVMAAAEAKRRTMMETSTNGALRGGCCARC